MELPEIPQTWLVGLLLASMVVMRFFNIDSWTTAALSSVMGYILGKHQEQVIQASYRNCVKTAQ